MIALPERRQILTWVEEARTSGARLSEACQLLGISVRTLPRWQKPGEVIEDDRRSRDFMPANKLRSYDHFWCMT